MFLFSSTLSSSSVFYLCISSRFLLFLGPAHLQAPCLTGWILLKLFPMSALVYSFYPIFTYLVSIYAILAFLICDKLHASLSYPLGHSVVMYSHVVLSSPTLFFPTKLYPSCALLSDWFHPVLCYATICFAYSVLLYRRLF